MWRWPIVRHRSKRGKQVQIVIWKVCVKEIKYHLVKYKCVPFNHWISWNQKSAREIKFLFWTWWYKRMPRDQGEHVPAHYCYFHKTSKEQKVLALKWKRTFLTCGHRKEAFLYQSVGRMYINSMMIDFLLNHINCSSRLLPPFFFVEKETQTDGLRMRWLWVLERSVPSSAVDDTFLLGSFFLALE